MDLLKGIRVVSFNHFLLGPVGMQILGDFGADIIAIEPVEGAFQRKWGGVNSKTVDGQTMLFLLGNRNKRSLALDLKYRYFSATPSLSPIPLKRSTRPPAAPGQRWRSSIRTANW